MGAFVQFKGFELGKLATKLLVVRRECQNLDKAFVRWNAKEEGGQLTKKIASRIAEHIKNGLMNETLFYAGRPGKDPQWVVRLTRMNAKHPTFLGLGATETLLNSIDSFSSGRGGYAVGIRKGAQMPVSVVNERGETVRYTEEGTKVEDVAQWLEFGTSRGQPNRPWFFRGFWQYIGDKLPEDIRTTILRDMNRSLRKMGVAANQRRTWADLQPEDAFIAFTGSAPAGIDLARVGETLGLGTEQDAEARRTLSVQQGPTALETEPGGKTLREEKLADGTRALFFFKEGIKQMHSYWDEVTQAWMKISE